MDTAATDLVGALYDPVEAATVVRRRTNIDLDEPGSMCEWRDDIRGAADAADLGVGGAIEGESGSGHIPVRLLGGCDPEVLGGAFRSWAAAVEFAANKIAGDRATLKRDLAARRHRALREAHGLPREIPRGVSDVLWAGSIGR